MSSVLPPRRRIVLKASRDTLVLLAVVGAMTLAIAYSVHNHAAAEGSSTEQVAVGEWAGQLTERSSKSVAAPAPSELLSSDALTLPKAAMALPATPKAVTSTKPRICDGVSCPTIAKTIAGKAAVAPPPRIAAAAPPARLREASLVEQLNPLNHLPAAVTRPLASASDTIVGWVKRF